MLFYLVKVLHERNDLSVAESKPALLAEDHDLAEADGAAVVDVDLIEELLERHLANEKTGFNGLSPD